MSDNRPTTPPLLRPWSIVDDAEIRLLRELRSLTEPLAGRDPEEVMYLRDGTTLRIGEIGAVLRRLWEELG